MKHNALYVTATGPTTGKSAIALGAMQMLTRTMRNVAIFRPIINEPQLDDRDPDINLMLQHFKLDMDYADPFAYTHAEARDIINQGSRNLLLENI
ncbi:MAG: AAA family ATPase, partial [Desulfovibrio sp.]|nr:AAA family ATPase [Desulfovibrio sp.]